MPFSFYWVNFTHKWQIHPSIHGLQHQRLGPWCSPWGRLSGSSPAPFCCHYSVAAGCQARAVWPRACGSDTCPDNMLLEKAVCTVLPASLCDHRTWWGAWQREALEEFLLQQRFYSIVLEWQTVLLTCWFWKLWPGRGHLWGSQRVPASVLCSCWHLQSLPVPGHPQRTPVRLYLPTPGKLLETDTPWPGDSNHSFLIICQKLRMTLPGFLTCTLVLTIIILKSL